MADIKDAIRTRLLQAGLTEGHLEEAGTHIIGSDGETLSVLVPEAHAKGAIDTLGAELRDPTGKKLKAFEVQDAGPVNLGDLGEWRKFDVVGLDTVEKAAGQKEPPKLHLVGVKEGIAVEGAFYTSLDLRFALFEVLSSGELFVRPIPEGQHNGKEWIATEDRERAVLHKLLGHWVDDTVPLDTKLAAAEEWRSLQSEVYFSGLIGAAVLGAAPEREEVPVSRVRGDEGLKPALEDKFGLGQAVLEFLQAQQIELPPRVMNTKWLEETLDRITDLPDVPHEVVKQLRTKFRQQKEKAAGAGADMFAAPEAEKPKVIAKNPAKVRQEQAEAIKYDRLKQALGHLDVPDQEIRRFARELSIATEPRRFPSAFFFTGPRHSAANKMLETAIELTGGKKPVLLDLGDPEFALAYGHFRGVPSDADGQLSKSVLDEGRGSQAAHVAIVVPDLMRVGSSAKDPEMQKAALVDWLERLDEMLRTGSVEVCTRGQRKPRPSPLANAIFISGCSDPEALKRIFAENPKLATLSTKVFGTGELSPEAGVANLERVLTFRLRQHYGPKGAGVELSDSVKSTLVSAFGQLGAGGGMDVFERRLSDELVLFARGQPAAKYTIEWSAELSAKDIRKIGLGELPGFVDSLFDIRGE
jgi:hypothetical protein